MSLAAEIKIMAKRALDASRLLAQKSAKEKNDYLLGMALALEQNKESILSANQEDLNLGKKAGLSAALLDRLALNEARIEGMAQGLREVVLLADPVGEIISQSLRPNGLALKKIRVPIGVIAMIYEARPNVTADAACLCIKAGNAIILRGGKEAINSNSAIAKALQIGGSQHGMPLFAVQFIESLERDAVKFLVQLEGLVDLVIPRGGESLIRAVTDLARVPVLKHYQGICHTYVDQSANIEMALAISENAKCQRPGVCNAMETLLVHEVIADEFLPLLADRLAPYSVELRGDELSRIILPSIKPATEEDWSTEYLDLILSIKVVPDFESAISHINHYGSHHSDAVVTESELVKETFLKAVDSAAVFVNASTRFTDGSQFGMGAEIGISTDKLHARGPMGLAELTTYKYLIEGSGQIRE